MVPTLEVIARAQSFDGGFLTSRELVEALFPDLGGAIPDLPPLLLHIAGGDEDKEAIWMTALTLAVLEENFGSEKAAWGVLEEKANDYLIEKLGKMNASDASDGSQLLKDLKAAAGLAVRNNVSHRM